MTCIVGLLVVQATDDPWTEAVMHTPRNSHTLTLLPDGRVLAAGGWDGASPLASAELYNPATGAWQTVSPMSDTRAYPTATLLPDGRVLVAGGWNTLGAARASAEVYDPKTNTWRTASAMRFSRAEHTATLLPTGLVLVVGGYGDDGLQAQAELYDPTTDTWAAAGTLRTARSHHTATLLPKGQVLIAGGWDGQNRPLASAELYDPASNTWAPAAALTTARLDHTATLLPDGTVLVAGGYNGGYLTSAETYDPAANTWRSASSMSTARAYHSATLLRNGKVLVAGGSNGGRPNDRAEVYVSTSRNWTPAGALRMPYESHHATLLRNDKVLIAGRPGNNDPNGNDGIPTPPGGVQTGPRPRTTPQPGGNPGAPQPTATPRQAGAGAESAAAGLASMAAAQATLPPKYTVMQETATLYGVHEINFSYSPGTSNPFDIPIDVTFTPPSGPTKTVRAFWDDGATWRARVYVDQRGTWSWSCASPCSTPPIHSFIVNERPESGLHGMLRVSTSPKRWYTDDGRTFLPMADTAYKLFFETPSGFPATNGCPTPRDPSSADAFIQQYVEALGHKVNVLRVTALGTWAYEDAQFVTGDDPRSVVCETDLSLFWSSNVSGQNQDMYDGGPAIAQVAASAPYPNLQSFARTDRKLTWLLNYRPDLYVQILLAPEPKHTSGDHTWTGIDANVRKRLWDTMIARWAAFPNVFWSVSSDLDDTKLNNAALGKEVGCYFAGVVGPDCTGIPNFDSLKPAHDPWHQNRPISLGHLRNRLDSFATAPWHTYITAYSAADLSAQQMDGNVALPEGCHNAPQIGIYKYAEMSKPVLNVEDEYESASIAQPAYFYRRFFWSYLLSGGGATYGGVLTSEGKNTYTTAGYSGLNGEQHINAILHDARINLSLFTPADRDSLVTMTYPPAPAQPPANWAEFNRPQVARRGSQELLAYIPNTVRTIPSLACSDRVSAVADTTQVKATVDLSKLVGGSYFATWYNPGNGMGHPPIAYTGQEIQAPFPGDAVLHIGPAAWCSAPNVCEDMDGDPPLPDDPTTTIETGADQNARFMRDQRQNALNLDYAGNGSWRCDWMTPDGTETSWPGCWVRNDFSDKPVASADFYFRRNNAQAYTGVYFITMPAGATGDVSDGANATSLDVFFNPEGDLFFGMSQVGPSVIQETVSGVAPLLDRWYHLVARVERMGDAASAQYTVKVDVDGVNKINKLNVTFTAGAPWFRRVVVHTGWWSGSAPTGMPAGVTGAVWWDELSIDPPAEGELVGLFRASLQQGVGGYQGTQATWFDPGGGFNATTLLHAGNNGTARSLLRFSLANLPPTAVIDEAILQVYYTGRSNGNTLTLGAHRVLADWTDSQVTWTQRQTGFNWQVAGMGSGSDYTAAAAAAAAVNGAGGSWVDLSITGLAQTWLADPAQNKGLVLLQEAASGSVFYDFCSELGWSPCTAAQAPKLTLRYHLVPPPPVKATFQRGVNGYTDNQATWLDATGGYNNTAELLVGQNGIAKALLKFDVTTIPITATVDEATLQLYQTGRSNGNTLTLGAHRVLADWVDSQVNWTQRKTGVNWGVAGMGSGSDYVVTPDGAASLTSAGGAWVDLDVQAMAQAWVNNPAANRGLVLTQDAASGYVYYTFCSELGWSPCSAALAPKLTIWYH